MSRRLAEGFDAEISRADRPPVRAVVALGANLGDRAATLDAAVAELRRLPLVDDVKASATGRVGRGQAGRPGCRGPGVSERRRARHHPPGPVCAARVPAGHRDAPRARAARAVGRPDARPGPHRVRTGDQQRCDPHAPASPRRRTRLRARAVADDRSRCRAARPGPGRRTAGAPAGLLVKRTGAAILVLAAAIGLAAGFLLDQALTAAGRATFIPSVTLPIFLAAARRDRRGARPAHPPRYAWSRSPSRSIRSGRCASRCSRRRRASSARRSPVRGGLALFLLTRPVSPSVGSLGAIIATGVCGALLVAAGLYAEHLCTIRKDDDDEQPGGDGTPDSETHDHCTRPMQAAVGAGIPGALGAASGPDETAAASDVLDRDTYRAIREPRSAARLPLGDGTWHQLARQYVWVQLISTGSLRADRARRVLLLTLVWGQWWAWIPGGIFLIILRLDADHHPAPGARLRLSAAARRPRLPARHPVAARGGGALRAHAARRHHPRPARPRFRHRAAQARHRGGLDRRRHPGAQAGSGGAAARHARRRRRGPPDGS